MHGPWSTRVFIVYYCVVCVCVCCGGDRCCVAVVVAVVVVCCRQLMSWQHVQCRNNKILIIPLDFSLSPFHARPSYSTGSVNFHVLKFHFILFVFHIYSMHQSFFSAADAFASIQCDVDVIFSCFEFATHNNNNSNSNICAQVESFTKERKNHLTLQRWD